MKSSKSSDVSWVISEIERLGAIFFHSEFSVIFRIDNSGDRDGARKFASTSRVDFSSKLNSMAKFSAIKVQPV